MFPLVVGKYLRYQKLTEIVDVLGRSCSQGVRIRVIINLQRSLTTFRRVLVCSGYVLVLSEDDIDI